jgi:hypothetical protein
MVVAGMILFLSSSLGAQDVATTFYVGAGPEAVAVNVALGLRADVFGVWGGYARAALRGAANLCEESLPPRCTYPEGEAYEFAGGLTYPRRGELWLMLLSAGGGVLSWQHELDPFVDVTFDLRRSLTGPHSLMLGVSGVYAPNVERKPNGLNAIVSEKNVFFVNVTLGHSLVLD